MVGLLLGAAAGGSWQIHGASWKRRGLTGVCFQEGHSRVREVLAEET